MVCDRPINTSIQACCMNEWESTSISDSFLLWFYPLFLFQIFIFALPCVIPGVFTCLVILNGASPPSLLLEGALLWLGWMMLRCGLVEVDTVWLRNQREVVTIRPLLTSFWLTLWVGHCFRAKGRSIRSEFKVSSAVLSWKQQHLPFWWSVWIQGQWFV